MELTSGARLGPYEIVSRLGAGGIGEAYCARDMRRDEKDVANADAVERTDVRMIELRDRLRLALEPELELRAGGEPLDRDAAVAFDGTTRTESFGVSPEGSTVALSMLDDPETLTLVDNLALR